MSSSSARMPTPEGPGSVSDAPQLPEGFTGTFTSRYIAPMNCQHAVIEGDGRPARLCLRYYFSLFSDPDVLRGSFGSIAPWDTTLAQNEQRKSRPLTVPVLAIGGAEAGVKRSGTGSSPPRTTCRAWSSKAPATGLPSRLPRRCWRR